MDERESKAISIADIKKDDFPTPIRDRIQKLIRIRARDLVKNKKNWKRHARIQSEAVRALLIEIGYADVIIVRPLPDGKYEIIDGHLRAELTPDAMVPVK